MHSEYITAALHGWYERETRSYFIETSIRSRLREKQEIYTHACIVYDRVVRVYLVGHE